MPRNCITRHESVNGAVVLTGHDHAGRVQIAVTVPDAASVAPELVAALLCWFLDMHASQGEPRALRLVA